jgi:hypothetical protein
MRRQNLIPGRLANLLLPRSEETKRKISEGVKRNWALRRERSKKAGA